MLRSPVHSAAWVTNFGTDLFIFALKKYVFITNKKL